MGEIRIRKGRAKPLWRGHPWVFADSIESVEGFPEPGELVTVRAPDGRVIGCGSLIELTPALAEIRSLAVAADYHSRGLGGQIVGALLDLARQRGLDQVCALTLRPNFFQRQGFQVVDRWNLTPKIWHECVYCPKFHRCDEVAMMMNLADPAAAPNPAPWWRVLADRAPQPVLRWLAPRRA
jgi:N-acetylglutamate synthase-like GNAT family acetyltransferase